jgi:hypothetical protein
MGFTLYFGPEKLDEGALANCLEMAQRLQKTVHDAGESQTLSNLSRLYALVKEVNPATGDWYPEDVEDFSIVDLPERFEQLKNLWGLSSRWVPKIIGERVFKVDDLDEDLFESPDTSGQVADIGHEEELACALEWVAKLGYAEELGLEVYQEDDDDIPAGWEDWYETKQEMDDFTGHKG